MGRMVDQCVVLVRWGKTPRQVAVAAVINHLRNMAFHSTIAPKERLLAVFHQTFLEVLHRYGRVNEVALMQAFNRKPGVLREKIHTGMLKEELALGWALWRKGKLHLVPRRSKAIEEIKAVYRRHRGEVD